MEVISLRLTSEINMRLEELSAKELAILELLDNKNYVGVKSIAKRTGAEYKEIFRIISDRSLLREFREIKYIKEQEKLRIQCEKEIAEKNAREGLRKRQKEIEEEKRKLKREKEQQEIKETETKILEAICNKGCEDIKSISDVTEIHYLKVWKIINKANLLDDLREIRKKEDYEKVKNHYRKGMKINELVKTTGVSYHLIREPLKKVKEELAEKELPEQKNLAYILQQVILKRAQKEEPAFYYAYAYFNKPRKKLSFQELYERAKDIYEIYSVSECARRWGITYMGALFFMKNIGMEEIHKGRAKYWHKKL